MKYLLDANAVIGLLNGNPVLGVRVRRHTPADIGISSIVVHELFYGAYKSQRKEGNVALVDALLFDVLDFDKEDARASGEIRAHLAGRGTPVGPYDVLIAGQAAARDLVLITHNSEEFRRVPGLKIEDWQTP